jgi:hypothetical protein
VLTNSGPGRDLFTTPSVQVAPPKVFRTPGPRRRVQRYGSNNVPSPDEIPYASRGRRSRFDLLGLRKHPRQFLTQHAQARGAVLTGLVIKLVRWAPGDDQETPAKSRGCDSQT